MLSLGKGFKLFYSFSFYNCIIRKILFSLYQIIYKRALNEKLIYFPDM